MNLCIDIGNSLTKTAVFDYDTMVHSSVCNHFGKEEFNQINAVYPVNKCIISSVKDEKFQNEFNYLENLLILDAETKIPVANSYQTPKTLGKDRLAAVIGANYLYPAKNILVIDAGSAITFDFITEKGVYIGGNIAPGLTMRFKALHHFTSKLPLLTPDENFPLLGRNTSEAIVSGVQNSIIFETDTYINELGKVYDGMITLVTGGDSKFFDNKLKNTIFVIPNLVLIGLNRILNFNA